MRRLFDPSRLHLPFLNSELESGGHDSLLIGRHAFVLNASGAAANLETRRIRRENT